MGSLVLLGIMGMKRKTHLRPENSYDPFVTPKNNAAGNREVSPRSHAEASRTQAPVPQHVAHPKTELVRHNPLEDT